MVGPFKPIFSPMDKGRAWWIDVRGGVMRISFAPIDEQAASEIVRWCYEPPYEIYNL